jgi:hypothetical protein
VKAVILTTTLSLVLIATISCSRTHADPQPLSAPAADVPHSSSSSPESTNSQTADLIARVKDASASKLEKGLPPVRFEDWVLQNTGPDWTISWGFTQGGKDVANHVLDSGSVDVRGDTKDGRYFRVSIGTTTTSDKVFLFWLNGAANVDQRWVGLEHLSQLPRLLHHARGGSHNSAGQK